MSRNPKERTSRFFPSKTLHLYHFLCQFHLRDILIIQFLSLVFDDSWRRHSTVVFHIKELMSLTRFYSWIRYFSTYDDILANIRLFFGYFSSSQECVTLCNLSWNWRSMLMENKWWPELRGTSFKCSFKSYSEFWNFSSNLVA